MKKLIEISITIILVGMTIYYLPIKGIDNISDIVAIFTAIVLLVKEWRTMRIEKTKLKILMQVNFILALIFILIVLI
ncbi:MAG: hypothetical protein LBT37_07200 [Lactobacillaceae bacterium]|jgi:hypothetical protein|nr:hypothetical protein [Lactobacillaceae bacterium]